ncbi:MAG: TlyA family RNA methyltransferase [Geminicoccaceae bacterium]|nr:TlyA family RNA methyltransferase [Geminicoccaceae bacterium]
MLVDQSRDRASCRNPERQRRPVLTVTPSRLRLDQLVVERGLAGTRSKAQALIMAGEIFSGERRMDKPGTMVATDADLRLAHEGPSWASRGALKLIEGLDRFAIDPSGLIAIDVGASTGGFTHVLLERGALRVYAVDVGHGQLDWRLRNDPRVVVLERTNARHLSREQIPMEPALVVCDASFISLTKVLPAALALSAGDARCVALIKPQFEAGRSEVGRGGVVRDETVRQRVCEKVREWLELAGWTVDGIVESPITGPKGNHEYLVAAKKTPAAESRNPICLTEP